MDQAVDYYRNRFRELDQNGDKFLEASELDAAIPIMDATSGKELVLKLDRNSDGKLSEDEFGVIANWLFQLAKSPAQLRFSDVECDEVPEVRSGNGLEENDPSSGRDMRTYYCRPCMERIDVDNGVALWQVLHDAREKD